MQSRYFSLKLIPILTLIGILTIWLRLSIIRTTYAIHQAEQQVHQLQQEKEHLELRVTADRSPRKLEGVAKTKFGLSRPRPEQVIRMRGI